VIRLAAWMAPLHATMRCTPSTCSVHNKSRHAASTNCSKIATVVPMTEASGSRKPQRRMTGRVSVVICATLVAGISLNPQLWWSGSVRSQEDAGILVGSFSDSLVSDSSGSAGPSATAFLSLDEKDGRFCGKEGDMCKCFGHVRYGRLFSWSDDLIVDGSVNCSAASFGDPTPMSGVKICKCYTTLCTTDVGICTPEPCGCPTSRDPAVEWAKKTLMTGDGTKCWACEKRESVAGVAVDTNTAFCPAQIGRCTLNRFCKCEDQMTTKRMMRTKDGKKCWTCAAQGDSGGFGLDNGQKAMFWMLPLLWPFMDFPNSTWEVYKGCFAMTTFLILCVVGYILQNFVPILNLNRFFSFFAPCMKKGEFWRLFTYFMLHSDLQHLCINLFHLMDALDLEGVPDLEVSPGVPLRCSRNGPLGSVCYPNVGIGRQHTIAVIALVLAYGALLGTIKSFGALVQGASSVCFGVDGALIALYGMFLGAKLDNQLSIPDFGSFFWMRIGILSFHIIIDVIQSVCKDEKDTVGTIAHMSSLVAGFCYVVLVLPPMGDGTLFTSLQPYIVNCGLTSPKYVTLQDASTPCIAFFRRGNGIEVGTAQLVAGTVLVGGVLISAINAFLKRHISDDGYACCSCGDVPMKEVQEEIPSVEQTDAEIAALKTNITSAEGELKHMERMLANMPSAAAVAALADAGRGGSAGTAPSSAAGGSS